MSDGVIIGFDFGEKRIGVRHPDGQPHEMTNRCERFARQLEGRFHLPVNRIDERYSSAVVDSDADFIDDEAACIILQQFFNESAFVAL